MSGTSTVKTFTPTHLGSIWADVTSHFGTVKVTVDPNARNATVTVSTSDTEGPLADAVNNTTLREVNSSQPVLHVDVPKVPGGGSQSISFAGGSIQVSGNYGVVSAGQSVTGMTISNGDVWFGGQRIVSNGRVVAEAGTVVSGSGTGTIRVEITLPRDSSLRLTTTSADLAIKGDLMVLDAQSVSGDIEAGTVHDLAVNTTSGDVEVRHVTARADVHSVSGDVEVRSYEGSSFAVNSVSGDIDVAATSGSTGRFSVNTVSGDVTTRGADHLNPSVRTVSGKHRRR